MADTENRDKVSLIDCMQDVPDPRAPYNQKHKFLDIIIIAITAVLSGMDTWNEIEDWVHSKRDWLKTCLELPGGKRVREKQACTLGHRKQSALGVGHSFS